VKQEARQDGVPASAPEAGDVIKHAVAVHRDVRGALLPILHAIQDRLGYLPPDTVNSVADGLNLSRADVHGVITFYPDFRTQPPGRHVIRVCRAEACQAMGAEALIAHLEARHQLKLGDTRGDGAITAEQVFCLGNCALSPAVLVDGQPHGRVSPARLDELLAGLTQDAKP
jgi:formate dehydrogenase subunit gamma